MSELIQINDTAAPDLSRREMLRGIALALTAAGVGSLDPVSAQGVDCDGGQGDPATAGSGLRFLKCDTGPGLLDGLVNRQRPPVKVNILPAQAFE